MVITLLLIHENTFLMTDLVTGYLQSAEKVDLVLHHEVSVLHHQVKELASCIMYIQYANCLAVESFWTFYLNIFQCIGLA